MIVAIVGLLVGAAMGIMLMCMVIVGDDKGKTWTCELCEREAENAKLREESSKYHDLYVHAITDAEVWHLQWSAEHQENAKLRKLAQRMWPAFTGEKRATFADRLHVRAEIDELEITVTDESRASASE